MKIGSGSTSNSSDLTASSSEASKKEPKSIQDAVFGHLGRAVDLLFSPSSALAFGLLGYYSLAGFNNAFLPEGSLGGILIRLAILIIVVVTFLKNLSHIATSRQLFPWMALMPVATFFIVYSVRLVENFYFSDINFPPGPSKILLIFALTGVGTSFLIARIAPYIRDADFIRIMSGLCVVFLAGLAINFPELQKTIQSNLALFRINSISLAHTAFAFFIYYLLVFLKSRRLTVEAVIFAPVMIMLVVYARSRAAYIAGAGTILVYLALLQGVKKRVAIVLALAFVGFAILLLNGWILDPVSDVVSGAIRRLNPNIDTSTFQHLQLWTGAWEQFLTNPFLGKYAMELEYNYYPHNIYLESLMSVGLIGSAPFIIHIGLAVRSALGILRSTQFPVAATFLAILFVRECIASAAANSIWGGSGFWITSILVIVFWYGRLSRTDPITQKLPTTP